MGWDQAPDTVARDLTHIYDRILQNHQPQGCLPKPLARDTTTPVQTRLSARRKESAKKNTQRRNGVRMRHRRTVARRNRNGRGMGDAPSWRQTADACCYSRALLATLFLQRIGPDAGFVRLVMPALLLIIYRLSFALRPNHPAGRNRPRRTSKRNPQ